MYYVILFIISVLPVVLLGKYIYNKDRNKEPFKILFKLFLAGIFTCFLVLFLTAILIVIFPFFALDTASLDYFQLFIYVFIGISLIEESCKWLMTYLISYNSREFDEIYDMLVYSAFVSLGFACFENILYVFSSGFVTGIIRAILSVPGHACYGIFMGYYLGIAKQCSINKRNDLKIKNIFLSIVVPVIMHGVFDYCLFTENLYFILFLLIAVIITYIIAFKKIKRMSAITAKMVKPKKCCTNCGNIVESNFCPNCGNKNE